MSKTFCAIPVFEGMSADLLPGAEDSEKLLDFLLDRCHCVHETIELRATSTYASVRFKVIKSPSQFFEVCEAILANGLAEGIARAFLAWMFLGCPGNNPLLPLITKAVEGLASRAVWKVGDCPINWKTLGMNNDGPLYIAVVPSDPVGNDNVLRRLR